MLCSTSRAASHVRSAHLALGLATTLLSATTSHAAFSDIQFITDSTSAYSWDGSPSPPSNLSRPATAPGIFEYDLEANPGNTNFTRYVVTPDELSITWNHNAVVGANGRASTGSRAGFGIRVDRVTQTRFEGYMSTAPGVSEFSILARVWNEFESSFTSAADLGAYETDFAGPIEPSSVPVRGPGNRTYPFHTLSGSATQTLLPGNLYFITFSALHEIQGPEGTNHAFDGYMRLVVVPEPSTAILLGLGLMVTSRVIRGR